MTLQIREIFGWKKGERSDPPKLGITKRDLTPNKPGAISILAAYDAQHELANSGANVCIVRTFDTLLLRRAQLLQ